MRKAGDLPGTGRERDGSQSLLKERLKGYRDGQVDPISAIYWDIHHQRNLGLVLSRSRDRDLMLDVGCGVGKTIIDLQKTGRRCIGVDPLQDISLLRARQRATEAGQELALARSLGECLPFRDGQFDMVLLLSTLQHVADQKKTLKEARRVLKDSGHILVSVPMSRSISTMFFRSGKPAHFTRSFDIRELTRLLEENDFRVSEVTGCGFFPPLTLKVLTLVNMLLGPRLTRSAIAFLDCFAGRLPWAASSAIVLCEARSAGSPKRSR